MPSFFSKLKLGRQQAKEHNAKQAQKAKEEQATPAPAPYRHVPRHAGIDAMSGAPSSWNTSSPRARAQELNRRRSMPAMSARPATSTTPRYSFSAASPSAVPRSMHGAPHHTCTSSVRSIPPPRKTWQERMVVMTYSTEDLGNPDMDSEKEKEKMKVEVKEVSTIHAPSSVRAPRSRAKSLVMPRTGDSQSGALGSPNTTSLKSAGTRHSMIPRLQAPPAIADVWYHDPTAPPVPTIPEEFVNMKEAPKTTGSSVHVAASSVSSNASDTSSDSSSGPSSPSTTRTTPRSSLEKPPIPPKESIPDRQQLLARMSSSESVKPKSARFSNIEMPVISYVPKRDRPSSLRQSSYAELATPRQPEPITRQTALRSHVLSGLSDPIAPVETPVIKTKTRRFSMWASSKRPSFAAS